MEEKAALDRMAARLEELKQQGLEDSDEYEELSDEWQSLAQDLVLNNIFSDD